MIASGPLRTVTIGGRAIGPSAPCYVIAEAGFNHLGDLNAAETLVRKARKVGADAVKFQTFCAEDIALTASAHYRTLKSAEFGRTEFASLAKLAASEGITFLSTPFSEAAADLLEDLGVPAFKVASMDLNNLPLLRHIARKGKPMILSTGMGTLGEIETALATIRDAGNEAVVLLHCISEYPLDPRGANLRMITILAQTFRVPVGYSDHTFGVLASIVAVALGASILEKHFTLDRGRPGADNSFSIEPDELAALVADLRTVEESLGTGEKRLAAAEVQGRRLFRRGLYSRCAIPRGTPIDPTMLKRVRPAVGLPPEALELVVGRVARADIQSETPITWDVVE